MSVIKQLTDEACPRCDRDVLRDEDGVSCNNCGYTEGDAVNRKKFNRIQYCEKKIEYWEKQLALVS